MRLSLWSVSLVAALSVDVRWCVAQGEGAAVRDESAAVTRLLAVVRGVDPVLCELVVRSVDTHGWWSRWDGSSGNPLDVDSASAALIAWIQRKHSDPVVVPRLRTALRDPDGCVRRVAGSFLGRVEHPTAAAALVAALEDPSAETRQVAALGLGLWDRDDDNGTPSSVVEPLVRRLRDDSPMVRRSAAWALGSLEATGAITALIEALQRDTDPRVRQAAAWALGQVSG
jgi:hypothetical protein